MSCCYRNYNSFYSNQQFFSLLYSKVCTPPPKISFSSHSCQSVDRFIDGVFDELFNIFMLFIRYMIFLFRRPEIAKTAEMMQRKQCCSTGPEPGHHTSLFINIVVLEKLNKSMNNESPLEHEAVTEPRNKVGCYGLRFLRYR